MMHMFTAFGTLLTPMPLFFVALGTFLGITMGAIPGLSGSMLITLILPLTYFMEPIHAVVLLIGIYTGTISGGLISATLLKIPGTPAAVMTTFDGYPMAQAGRPGRALGLGIGASFVGGLISWVALATLSAPIAEFAVRFTPFDYFALVVTALVLISSVSEGSLVRGLLAAALGVLFAMPGVDPSAGIPRITFDWVQMNSGFNVLPVLIGLFAVGQMLTDIWEGKSGVTILNASGPVLMRLRDWKEQAVNLIRSSLIGTWIGILPGIGANIGSIVAYAVARNASKTPEKFGQGAEEGIVASEAANNATVSGALIPLVAIGIPGSVIDALLISALMIHSIQPGPLLFVQDPELVWGMITAALVANFLMLVMMIALVVPLSRLAKLPKSWLMPCIIVFSVVGAYAVSNRAFDVWVVLGFGLLGFLLNRARIPLGPFIIGFILAPIAEGKLRAGLMATDGDWSPLWTEPLTASLLLISVALLIWPGIAAHRRSRQTEKGELKP